MCGIFGAVGPGAPAVDVAAALATLHHRGPDSHGIYRGDGVSLGHARLAVIDLTEGGAQPKRSGDGQAVVTFNGEIYNHHALRDELRGRGVVFRSRSDTEVIVEGYRQWGDGVVERLDGMFALGLWDATRRRLLLARDRTGKKPLHYALTDDQSLSFASEVKALGAAGVPLDFDENALPYLLSFGYVPAPDTLYRGVRQLAPGSLLTFEPGRAPAERRYFHAPFAAPPLEVSVDEAAREVRRLVEAAVERRLEADVPLGAFLSGGIDSTVIVGVMARAMGRPVKTFSIGFSGDARFDETRYARIAARAFGTEHTEFRLEPSSFDLVERLVWIHDGPFGDSSAIPTSVVSQLTRQHVTVALTGDGGDELFCGYVRFLAAEAAERIPQPLRQLGARLGRFVPGSGGEKGFPTRARRFLDAAALPLADRLARWISPFAFDLHELIHPSLRATLPLAAPLEWMRRIVDRSAGASVLARTLDHNFESYLPYDLLVKADRASMAHSLETRSPFLDTALIEYAARLPDSMKRRGLTTKWILKHAFRDLLPEEIRTRGKMGFGMPLGAWFRGDLRDYLGDHLGPSARLYAYLDRGFVERLLAQHMDGRADHGHRLWLLLTLEIWLRRLAEGKVATRDPAPPPSPPARQMPATA